jgi:peptidoglycan/LPS O-acetylase OafA/YrhL
MFWVNNPSNANVFYHLSFLSNFDLINRESIGLDQNIKSQDITWSVSIEEQFYLFWPLLFAFIPKKFWIYSIIGVIVISAIYRISHFSEQPILYFHTLSVLVDLAMGALFACLIKSYSQIRKVFENSSTSFHAIVITVAFCLLLWNKELFSFKYGPAISRVVVSFFFALLIAAQAITKRESFLNLKNFRFASSWGKYTYGIYLIHPIVLTFVDIIVRTLHLPDNNFISLFFIGVFGFVLTLAVSRLSYKYFESKFLSFKDKFTVIHTRSAKLPA